MKSGVPSSCAESGDNTCDLNPGFPFACNSVPVPTCWRPGYQARSALWQESAMVHCFLLPGGHVCDSRCALPHPPTRSRGVSQPLGRHTRPCNASLCPMFVATMQAVPSAAEEAAQTALLLPWFAAFNRSQFAAQCFVEALVKCYQAGVEVDDLQVRRLAPGCAASELCLCPAGARLHTPAPVASPHRVRRCRCSCEACRSCRRC
jgi:hypothetical protein